MIIGQRVMTDLNAAVILYEVDIDGAEIYMPLDMCGVVITIIVVVDPKTIAL